VDGQAAIDLERPRSIPELIGTTVDLYFGVPILFLALAAVVVVPWEFVVLLVTGAGPLDLGHKGFVTNQLISLPHYFIVVPLISALHIHAVSEVGRGRRPRLLSTFRQSLPTLPAVVLATGVSGVATSIGYLALVVPGVLLTARWAVVAQTAALDGGGWTDAIRRSTDLTDGERWHAFWLIVVAGSITSVLWLAAWHLIGHETTTVGSFAVGTALQIVMRSFEALVLALLYFDLKGRQSIVEVEPDRTAPTEDGRTAGWYIDPSMPTRMRYWAADGTGWSKRTTKTPKPMLLEWQEHHRAEAATTAMAAGEHTGHSLDPDVYTDEGRPPGWYVDPDRPWRMRYWRTGELEGWSKETTKTPEKAQSEWRDLRWRR
jgi:Protein of unknown function (DUF2510)